MRKEYTCPEADLIQVQAEHQFLASIHGRRSVPDAEEGDTDSWGDWS